jgi:serine/threonine protein kinase
VWSLAVVAYEMLISSRPFHGSNIPETLSKICAEDYRTPSSCLGEAYSVLDPVFAKGLRRDLARRFQSAGDFARALELAVQRLPSASEPRVLSETSIGTTLGRSAETASLSVVKSSNDDARNPRTRLASILVLGACAVGVGLFLKPSSGRDSSPETAERHSADAWRSPELPASNVIPTALPPTLEPVASKDPTAASVTAPAVSAARSGVARALTPPRATQVGGVPSSAASVVPSTTSEIDPIFGLEVPGQQ